MKKECEISVEILQDKIVVVIQDYTTEFLNNNDDRKIVIALLKNLKSTNSNLRGITYVELSKGLGHDSRQWSHNFYKEFENSGKDFMRYLKRENKLEESVFPLIEEHLLNNIMINENQSYTAFLEKHSKIKIAKNTYSEYINKIEPRKIIKRIHEAFTNKEVNINTQYYLEKLLNLNTLKNDDEKEIKEIMNIPNEKTERKEIKIVPFLKEAEKYMLVSLFYACGMSQEIIGSLFGVCKTTVHNWLYGLLTSDMELLLISKIKTWSGKICVDEKWVKINGIWHYILSAVDQVTGFPLLIELHPTIDTNSWAVFFKKIKSFYGIPNLIISDGSKSLYAGKMLIFPRVCHQLCNFHKYRNLLKRIFQYAKTDIKLSRYLVLAKGIFCNKSVSARKHAAKKLCEISDDKIKAYVNTKILGMWRRISKGLTSNAVERFNRKLNKIISVRYGIKSIESMQVMIRSLWLKEMMLFGKKHLAVTDELGNIEMSKLCQENLNFSSILHFLKNEKGFYIDAA